MQVLAIVVLYYFVSHYFDCTMCYGFFRLALVVRPTLFSSWDLKWAEAELGEKSGDKGGKRGGEEKERKGRRKGRKEGEREGEKEERSFT